MAAMVSRGHSVGSALNQRGKALTQAGFWYWGIAYKKDVDDLRDRLRSASITLLRQSRSKRALSRSVFPSCGPRASL